MTTRVRVKHICILIAASLACACAPILSPQFVERDFTGDSKPPIPGDVLHLDTTFLQAGGIGRSQLVPMHVPWRIPLRHISSGALLPSEAALLQIALEVRRAENFDQNTGKLKKLTDRDLPGSPNTYNFVASHQVALWDALVDSMVISTNASGQFGKLKVDFGKFCDNLSYAIITYEVQTVDEPAITAFGNEVLDVQDCLHGQPDAPVIQSEITTLFDRPFGNYLNNQDKSSAGDVTTTPSVGGNFYDRAIIQKHARHAVVIERAGASLHTANGDERLWSLKEWQDSGICTDDSNTPLKIKWVKIASRKVSIKTNNHNVEIRETGGTRIIYDADTHLPLESPQMLFKIVADENSLAALYPSDVVAIRWRHEGKHRSIRPKLAESCQ
jgi:hypothetical protein